MGAPDMGARHGGARHGRKKLLLLQSLPVIAAAVTAVIATAAVAAFIACCSAAADDAAMLPLNQIKPRQIKPWAPHTGASHGCLATGASWERERDPRLHGDRAMGQTLLRLELVEHAL